MTTLIVVENPQSWALEVPGAEVVSARDYLTRSRFTGLGRATVFNLCRSYAYQSTGYYVSLLATARGHRPFPSVTTIQDLRLSPVVKIASEELDRMLQSLLAPLKSDTFSLSIYFGRNLASRYDRLARALFNYFPAPLLRAEMVLADRWRLHSLRTIAADEIPPTHLDFVAAQAKRFFARPNVPDLKRARYTIAILVNPQEVDAPSDAKAIDRFVRAARRLGMQAQVIGREDYGRIAEFDGLFIRETTSVNHHTYRFASRAAAEGLVVIDDPESIVRCSNKVYQAEMMRRRGIPTPRTLVVHRENAKEVGAELGFPCVLKRPDSSFSLGVVKANDEQELKAHLATFFARSELIVAQEFLPSQFDWRIGVLDGTPLHACRYHMVRGHWQIQVAEDTTKRRYGRVDTLGLDETPPEAIALAVRAANQVGRGFYGVDIKELDGRFVVMEINDNPSVEAGCEDAVLKDDLYLAVMRTFYRRFEERARELRPI
ncbi:MAG: RimK family protein [Myxococcales bacterium]|nr:RimK family protein [Myxococcales bacterium]